MVDLRHAARRLGRELHVKHSVTTVEAARSLVSAGLGIALQPASMLFLDDRDRVVTVDIEGAWAERSYRVGKLSGKILAPSAQALIEQLTSSPRDDAMEPPEDEGPAD